MIRFLKGLFLTLIVLLLNSCSALKIVKQNNYSVVAISTTSSGVLTKDYGITITLENIDTQEHFKSKSFSIMSPHSAILNIPPGRYIVRKVEVPVGGITYSNWSDNIKEFFGVIEIKPNSKYYLGNFVGTRSVGRRNVLKLRIENPDIPQRVIDKIVNKNTGWPDGDFHKLYPYTKDELIVY